MKSIGFWRREVRSLSLTERMFFRDAIRTLQSWNTISEEYIELDLIRRILESELSVMDASVSSEKGREVNPIFKHHSDVAKPGY